MIDYQLTYNGLTVGAGTSIQIDKLVGLEDLPDVRSGDVTRAYADGEIAGLDLTAGRDITVDLLVFDSGTGDYFTNLELVKAMSVPQASELVLTYQLPGRASRQLSCRPRKRSLPIDHDYQFRKGRAVVEFHATDPRIYSSTATALALTLPVVTGGLTFNATAPFVIGSASSGSTGVVTNSGNTYAPWVAQIFGPMVAPTLSLVGGGTVSLTGTVNSGETLVIDSAARSVLLNGTASRYSWVTSTSSWFTLPAGGSTVQFGAASGSGSCTFTYRSAWL